MSAFGVVATCRVGGNGERLVSVTLAIKGEKWTRPISSRTTVIRVRSQAVGKRSSWAVHHLNNADADKYNDAGGKAMLYTLFYYCCDITLSTTIRCGFATQVRDSSRAEVEIGCSEAERAEREAEREVLEQARDVNETEDNDQYGK
jgi:hypothetical protein